MSGCHGRERKSRDKDPAASSFALVETLRGQEESLNRSDSPLAALVAGSGRCFDRKRHPDGILGESKTSELIRDKKRGSSLKKSLGQQEKGAVSERAKPTAWSWWAQRRIQRVVYSTSTASIALRMLQSQAVVGIVPPPFDRPVSWKS